MILPSEVLRQQRIELLRLKTEKLRRICFNSFYNFFCNAWDIVWPGTKLVEAKHYALLAREIETQTERLKNREPSDYDVLIINVPFRTAKSTFFTICWNAWAWLHDPTLKFISWSHIEPLAIDHARRTKLLLESRWFNTVMKPKFLIASDQHAKGFFENNTGGYRKAFSVCKGLGEGGDIHLVDDPISRENALSEPTRKGVNSWLLETLPTRRNDHTYSLIVLIQQRVHENDTTGAALENAGFRCKHFCLPSDIEPGVIVKPESARKLYFKGLLMPDRFSKKILKSLKETLGSYTFNAQCRQMPSPPEGGIFNRTWWKFWTYQDSKLAHYTTQVKMDEIFTHEQKHLPQEFDDIILSGDLSFKSTKDSSRVAFGKWGLVGIDKFLLDVVVQRMDYVNTKKRVIEFYNNNLDASRFFIEDKANGPAILNDLRNDIPILIGKNPGQESKVVRASVVTTAHAVPMSAQCEAGHVYIPHPNLFPWVKDYIEEFAKFPNGTFDDLVDMSTQAINFWNRGYGVSIV